MTRRFPAFVALILLALPLCAPAMAAPAVPGAEAPAISHVQVSNVRDIYFAVSWLTSESANAEVRYGATPALGQVAHDTRGSAHVGQTHYVAITGLAPSTTYYFDVVSGGVVDNNGGAHWQVTTGPTLAPPTSDSIYGQVFLSDGATPAAGAIVYLRVQNADGVGSGGQSALLSSLVTDDGYWFLNLRSARTADAAAYFEYSASGDQVAAEAHGAHGQRGSLTVDTANDAPAPPMVLSGGGPGPAPLWFPLIMRDAQR
ncbi:MAG: hypothetical protein GX605_09365 [Chloroflexi bacterium]|nr:hypothetical protein [Chloroflexota bacterium]